MYVYMCAVYSQTSPLSGVKFSIWWSIHTATKIPISPLWRRIFNFSANMSTEPQNRVIERRRRRRRRRRRHRVVGEREMEEEFRIRREEWRGVIIVSSNPYPGSNRNENRASRKIGVPAYTVHNMHEWMIARDYRLAWRDIAESIRFGVLSFFIREPLVRNEEWNICNCWNIKWNILYVLGILKTISVSFLFFVVAKD